MIKVCDRRKIGSSPFSFSFSFAFVFVFVPEEQGSFGKEEGKARASRRYFRRPDLSLHPKTRQLNPGLIPHGEAGDLLIFKYVSLER